MSDWFSSSWTDRSTGAARHLVRGRTAGGEPRRVPADAADPLGADAAGAGTRPPRRPLLVRRLQQPHPHAARLRRRRPHAA